MLLSVLFGSEASWFGCAISCAGLYNPKSMDTGLKDKVAIVAASSQGIGLATAEAFAAEGCRLAMCARNALALEGAAEKIRKQYGVKVLAQPFDVTDAGAVSSFVKSVANEFGAVDICVTNAGGPPAKGFLATTTEEWIKAVDANFLSAVFFAREVIPYMQKKHWGRIITITSITTKQPVPNLVLSNAVRAGVVGLVKSLANEFGKDGILVNNVGPGTRPPIASRNWRTAMQPRPARARRRSSRAGRLILR